MNVPHCKDVALSLIGAAPTLYGWGNMHFGESGWRCWLGFLVTWFAIFIFTFGVRHVLLRNICRHANTVTQKTVPIRLTNREAGQLMKAARAKRQRLPEWIRSSLNGVIARSCCKTRFKLLSGHGLNCA